MEGAPVARTSTREEVMGIARMSSAGQRTSEGARALLGDWVDTAKMEEVWEHQRRNLTGGYVPESERASERARERARERERERDSTCKHRAPFLSPVIL